MSSLHTFRMLCVNPIWGYLLILGSSFAIASNATVGRSTRFVINLTDPGKPQVFRGSKITLSAYSLSATGGFYSAGVNFEGPQTYKSQYGQTIEDRKISGVSILSICGRGIRFVQLGSCSRHFVHCQKNRYAIRTCPGHRQVFVDGRCTKARDVKSCRDTVLNTVNEETRRLAEKASFCTAGAAIYRIPGESRKCSRQALICHDNRRDAIPVACPLDQVLASTMECIPAPVECWFGARAAAPIRDYLLRRHCYLQSYGYGQNGALAPLQECTTWTIDCSLKQPSLVHCEGGHVIDPESGLCTPWTASNSCPIHGICIGREWESVATGECSNTYVHCYGWEARYMSCSGGKVFVDGECRRKTYCKRGGDKCKIGERRTAPGLLCTEYVECVGDNRGRSAWEKRECPAGSAFDRKRRVCRPDRSCGAIAKCNYGDSYAISCEKFMFCTGQRFEIFSCPPYTRWEAQRQECVPDRTCKYNSDSHGDTKYPRKNPDCRTGDLLHTADCKKFSVCVRGQFYKMQCNRDGKLLSPCWECLNKQKPTDNYYQIDTTSSLSYVDYTTFPGQCEKGTRMADDSDCSAYYKCKDGAWQYRRCPDGSAFDWSSGRCTKDGWNNCAASTQVQCRHGTTIFSEYSCDDTLLCINGQWQKLQCPKGYIYDPRMQQCVFGKCSTNNTTLLYPPPSRVDEYETKIYGAPAPPPVYAIEEKTSTSYGGPHRMLISEGRKQRPSPPGFAPVCSGSSRLPDPLDCGRYSECHEGILVPRVCPQNTKFNSLTARCEDGHQCFTKANEECQSGWFQPADQCSHFRTCVNNRWQLGRCSFDKAFINGKCSSEDCNGRGTWLDGDCERGSFRPHPTSNDKYWVCEFGQWVERSCSPGTQFVSNACRPSSHNNARPPAPPPSPQQCYYGQKQAIRGDCTSYLECVNGQMKRFRCEYGSGFVYNRCVPGGCGTKPEEETCRESGGADGYRQSRRSCREYYQCAQGRWVRRDCAPGTAWNPSLTVCDHIGNVPQCRESPINTVYTSPDLPNNDGPQGPISTR